MVGATLSFLRKLSFTPIFLTVLAVFCCVANLHAESIQQNSLKILSTSDATLLSCGFSKEKKHFVAVKVSSSGKLKSIQPAILKVKLKLLALIPPQNTAEVKKSKQIKSKLQKLKKQMKLCKVGPPTAHFQELTLVESQIVNFQLSGTTPRLAALNFEIVTQPEHGTLSGVAPSLTYNPTAHFIGEDRITFRVSDGALYSATTEVIFSIATSVAEFSGDPYSLVPYRENLTSSEVRQLLRKVALSGSDELYQIGINSGRETLIQDLLNQEEDPTVEPLAIQQSYYTAGAPWGTPHAQRYWLVHMLLGNPFKELMALHLHDHFALDTSRFDRSETSSVAIFDHMNLVRSSSLGNFEDLTNAMTNDLAMNYWLDNRLNTVTTPNENYGREIMELFMLGARRQLTGEPNYEESSILPATRSLSGFTSRVINGVEIVGYDPSLHDNDLKTIFPGTAWASTQNFDDQSFVHYVLNSHPESARYIAGKFFTLLVHPFPNEAVIDELASDLKANGFNIRSVLEKILRSSAMFSNAARKVCIESPVQYLVGFMRTVDMPGTSAAVLNTLRSSMESMGELPLQPPSVFGFWGCGVNRYPIVSDGDVWVAAQRLLESQNALDSVMNVVAASTNFNFLSVLPSSDATATESVDYLLGKFDIQISEQGRGLLLNYLNTTRSIQNGAAIYASTPWSAMTNQRKTQKIAGLLEILGVSLDSRSR